MSTTELGTQVVSAGREALSRAVRQTVQALVPTLLVVAGGSITGIDAWSVLLLAGVTALVSFLRSVTDFRAGPEYPKWAQVADRALAAAAGTTLGLVTVDGVTAAAHIDWQATLTAAIGSAVLAVAMAYTNPPVIPGPQAEPIDDLYPSQLDEDADLRGDR